MSGYDKEVYKQPTLNLMARRLGLTYNNVSVNEKILKTEGLSKNEDGTLLGLQGIENQAIYLEYNGGRLQQERMIYDKRRSLDRAVLYSYQAGGFRKIDADPDERPVRGLMNPNKVKQDYDEKIISIGYEHGFETGTVFEWMGTKTYWLIYLQELTELAYFRGNCRKCSYKISIPVLNEDGHIVPKEVFASIMGPTQPAIYTKNYDGISHDELNNTIKLLVPKTPETVAFFDRRVVNNGETYDKFALRPVHETFIRWLGYHVENADWLSTPGAIEVTALEVHYRPEEFDENGLFVPDNSDKEMQKVEDFNDYIVEDLIVGETFIKPTIAYTYTYDGEVPVGEFVIEGSKAPVHIIEKTNSYIKLKWTRTHSGQFNLIYRTSYKNPTTGMITTEDVTKVIVAESLY
jgi:hypothetical protein